eukprot:5057595-Ditylum_brightwellii.AAC.1
MSAVDSAMSDVSMQCCDAVTAVLTRKGQTHFFGVRRGCYSPTLTDDEAVVNNHLIREAGWQVDCVAQRHGGSQCMWLPTGDDVPLEYDANKYKLFMLCCQSTPIEINALPIHWVDCHTEDLEIDSSQKPVRRKPVSTQMQIIDPEEKENDPALVDANTQDTTLHPQVQFKGFSAPSYLRQDSQQNTLPEKPCSTVDNPAIKEKVDNGMDDETAETTLLTSSEDSFDWKETLGFCSEEVV